MKVAAMVPVVIPHPYQAEAIGALLGQRAIDLDLLLIRNDPGVEGVCAKYEKRPGVSILRPQTNLGVAASWNAACRWAFCRGHSQVAIFADDFILQSSGGLADLSERFKSNPEGMYHFPGFGYASFAVSRGVWEATGLFDEGFWPGGYEDFDYLQRVRGKTHMVRMQARHIGGQKLYRNTWLDELMRVASKLNAARYVHKWGGDPSRRLFMKPWNGRNPTVGPTRELMSSLGIINPLGRLLDKNTYKEKT